MLIVLDTLDFSLPVVRRIPPKPRADKVLQDSIAARRLPNWRPVPFGAAGPESRSGVTDHAASHEVESATA